MRAKIKCCKNMTVGAVITTAMLGTFDDEDVCWSLIESQTGTGKTYMIQTTLYTLAKELDKKILLLSPRTARKWQNEKDFDIGEGIMDCMNYQKLEMDILKGRDIKHYDYVVVDECQYIYSDAEFNRRTDLSWEWIKKQKNSNIIFMSATIGLFEKGLKEEGLSDYIKYTFEPNYDYIEEVFFYRNEDSLKKMLLDLPENEKAIYFTSAKKALDMKNSLPNAAFYCSKYNSEYRKYRDKKVEEEILEENENLSFKVLCTTTVIDSGVNIFDKDIKHVIVDIFDLDTLKQCVGRRRVNYNDLNDKIKIYVRKQVGGDFKKVNDITQRKLEQAEFLKENGYIEFARKHRKETISKMIDPIVEIDESGNEKLVLKINEMMYRKAKDTMEKVNMFMEGGYKYESKIMEIFDKKEYSYKLLEKQYPLIVKKDILDGYVGTYITREMKPEIIGILKENCQGETIKKTRGTESIFLSTFRKVMEENNLRYGIEIKKVRIKGRKQEPVWWISKLDRG